MLINQVPTEKVESASSDDELLRVENEYWAELAQALLRLEGGNPRPDDFKKVILDGYFKDKAINGVSLLAIDSMKPHRGDIIEQLNAISNLQDYFNTIKGIGLTPVEEDDEE